MSFYARTLRQSILVALALLMSVTLGGATYALWRLHTDALNNGLEIAAMHTRSFENFLTQSLSGSELAATNILTSENWAPELRSIEGNFLATLQHMPFLRSLSLADADDRIIASSNPANVGTTVATKTYLPPLNGTPDILRIGQPWAGRDFAGGHPSTFDAPVSAQEQSFIPVTRTLRVGGRDLTLLIALNSDFFVNHLSQQLEAPAGAIEVLRYDGTLLLSTNPEALAGSLHEHTLREVKLTDKESGTLFQQDAQGRHWLTAFRASRLHPFVVITHLDRAQVLQQWHTEANTLMGVLAPVLLAVSLLTLGFYRRQVQLAAQRLESQRLQRINATVFDASTEAILITNHNDEIVSVNLAFCLITGYSAQEMVGHHLFELLTPQDIASVTGKLPQPGSMQLHTTPSAAAPIEVQQRCKDGRLIWTEILSTPEHDEDGVVTGYHRICRNINERKQAEEKLQLAASVFTHAREGIMITAADGAIIDVNEAFSRITGYQRDDVLGKNPRLLSSGRQDKAFYLAMWRQLTEKGHWEGEVWNRRKNGEVFAEMLTISTVRDAQGKPQHHVGLFSDISALKAHQKQLEQMAHYDALTGLPNRVLLADRLYQAMAQAQRRGQQLAVVYLDLDGFKAVNDNYGHAMGDQLLITVAGRMKQALREGDTLARIGGDEFVAVLVDLEDVSDSEPMLKRLLDAAAEPVQVDEIVMQVSASLGLAFYRPGHEAETDVEQLLSHADQAMYQAKLAGKNRYHIFSAG
jgi:diguanylate cyclase (GGDEF)-like protein/PAS domain S-box-containing protein